MKELNFTQNTQMGNLKGILRIIGKNLYFKYNDHSYALQAIESMKKKGAIIEFGKDKEWIKVDIFANNMFIKLGEIYIDLEEDKDFDIEEKLAEFYIQQYKKMGFFVEVRQ